MPFYLWPMTSLHLVLAGYRLVKSGPCTWHMPFFHMCPKSACCSLVRRVWRFACTVCRPFFNLLCELLFDFPLPLRAGLFCYWALHFFRPISWLPSFPAISLCHFYCNNSILLGLFRPTFYSFPQWLSMAIGFPIHGLLHPFWFSFGHPWPICFLWASLTLLLTLHSHGFLLTSLDFPNLVTLFSSLRFIGLPLTPYFLCLHYFGPVVAHSHFFISYTTHGYAISFFLGFFKPIYLLKTHLFISWAGDSLFLPFGPNDFTTCLPALCCHCGWAFFFLLGFSKMTLNNFKPFPDSNSQRERERELEREREREPSTSRNQTHWQDRAPTPDAPSRSSRRDRATWSCRLISFVLLWVRSSPPLGRSRRPPLVDLSPPLGWSRRRSAFSLWPLIFCCCCCGGVGGGVLVVSVLCGGGFCVDSGGFSVGVSVWVVVDFLWVLMCGWWWILWYKICLEAEKMWKIYRKIAFSEYYQILKIVF